MRHGKRRTRLNRKSAHRKSTLNLMAKSLFISQSIKTTMAKAKQGRRVAEKLIQTAKQNSIFARRLVFSVLRDETVTKKLFDKIVPLFSGRNGGYTRIIPLKYRRGDGANIVILELTEKIKEDKPLKAKAKKGKKEAPAKTSDKPEPKQAPKKEIPEDKKIAFDAAQKSKAENENKKIPKKSFFKKFFKRKTGM